MSSLIAFWREVRSACAEDPERDAARDGRGDYLWDWPRDLDEQMRRHEIVSCMWLLAASLTAILIILRLG